MHLLQRSGKLSDSSEFTSLNTAPGGCQAAAALSHSVLSWACPVGPSGAAAQLARGDRGSPRGVGGEGAAALRYRKKVRSSFGAGFAQPSCPRASTRIVTFSGELCGSRASILSPTAMAYCSARAADGPSVMSGTECRQWCYRDSRKLPVASHRASRGLGRTRRPV